MSVTVSPNTNIPIATDVIDTIHEPTWREACAIAYKIGVSGLERVIYRLLRLEQRVAMLERDQLLGLDHRARMFNHFEARIAALEAKIKTEGSRS